MSLPDASGARQRLGNALREARDRTGLNQTAFGQELGWPQSKISKLERAQQLPTEQDVLTWARAADVAPETLLSLAALARSAPDYRTLRERFAEAGGAEGYQQAFVATDAAAMRIFEYQPALVIGLCQTQAYAEELLRLPSGPGAAGASDEEINAVIARRLQRQQSLLWQPDPARPRREVALIMGEAAVRQEIGGPLVLRAQLDHLARLARRLTSVTIGVVPLSTPLPLAPVSGFLIHDNLVSIETLHGVLEIEDPADVAQYHRYRELLLAAAVTGPDMADLLQDILASL